MIYPSPAVIVRADTSILDTIQIMNRRGVGSVLVVSDDARMELVGIFTERDLLRKVAFLEHGRFWRRPIRTIMTSPVKTLELSKIDQAGPLMLRGGFRHLPVMGVGPSGKKRVLGVISMRDLYRASLPAESLAEPQPTTRLTLEELRDATGSLPRTFEFGIWTENSDFLKFLEKEANKTQTIRIRKLPLPAELQEGLKSPQLDLRGLRGLFLDLDSWEPPQWLALLRKLKRDPKTPKTVLFFNPSIYPPAIVKALGQMSNSKQFMIFAKPVNIPMLITRVAQFLGLGGLAGPG